jgi:diaminohydroxyphosphoribosylaminopyrimidine deaminase/5-amino-6-(5-phosphoribosylamino)uracil reductase
MSDPFPAVQGGGVTRLRDAGIEVEVGVCEAQARELNAPYLHLLREKAPWVIGKWAMSLDGKIATRTGDSRWISNARSREIAHRLRGSVDAIVVGHGTVDQDDPLLTARPPGPRVATRVVMSSRGLLPHDCALLRTACEVPVLVVVTKHATPDACRGLERAGCEVLVVDAEDQTKQLGEMLKLFGTRRWTNILVEGGGQILGRFLDGGLLDEVHVFIAPKLIGGTAAKSPLAGDGALLLAEATRFEQVVVECVDNDIWVRARGPRFGAGDVIAPRPV